MSAREGVEPPPEARKSRELSIYDYQLVSFRDAGANLGCCSDEDDYRQEVDISLLFCIRPSIRKLPEH